MKEKLQTYYCKDCFKKQEQIEELKKENEELKKLLQETGERMGFLNADRVSEIMKYKQALEEIRDRVVMPDSLPESYTIDEYILGKCNEVLNDYSLCEAEIEDLEMELRSLLSTNEIKIEVLND